MCDYVGLRRLYSKKHLSNAFTSVSCHTMENQVRIAVVLTEVDTHTIGDISGISESTNHKRVWPEKVEL